MASILIADDSPTEVLLFQQIMQTLGHETIVARDGEEAERLIVERVPDLVILDVVMPQKDGYQVCRRIRREDRLKHIKVIIVSTRNQESDKYWGMRQGADAYFGKPFDISDLVEIVRNLLDGTEAS